MLAGVDGPLNPYAAKPYRPRWACDASAADTAVEPGERHRLTG